MLVRMQTNSGGGTSNVKTGTFEITEKTVSQQITVDTGLGSAIKRFVVNGISSFFPQPSGGYSTSTSWGADKPNDYDMGVYGQAGYHTTISGTRYGTGAIGITSYDGNGKFVLNTTPNSNSNDSLGSYVWYAE